MEFEKFMNTDLKYGMSTERVETGLDLILHALILFAILTALFIYYISNLEVDAVHDQFSNILSSAVPQVINSVEKNTQHNIRGELKKIPFDTLMDKFSQPSTANTVNNNWVFRSMITMTITLLVIFLLSYALLSKACGFDIDLKHILIMNAVTFTLVGIVEFTFFTKVALKYVPIAPSLVSESLLGSTKDYFH